MKRYINFSIIFLLVSTTALANRTSKKLHQILAQVVTVQTNLSPQTANYLGDKSKAGQLDDFSAKFYLKQNTELQPLLNKLNKLEVSKLDFQDQISLQMQKSFLKEIIADNEFKEYEMPITAEGSFHVKLATMHRYSSFKTAEDFQNYLSKMKQVAAVMQQNMDNMQAGLARGFTQPKVIIQHFPDFIQTYIKDKPEDSTFYQPFLSKPKHISEEQFADFQQQAITTISDSINPSYKQFKSFMVETYIPGAKDNISAYSFPDGKAY